MRFIATASVEWASREMEPKLIAPVAKRRTMAAAGSTSSSGTGASPISAAMRMRNSPRMVDCATAASFTMAAYSLYLSQDSVLTACCSVVTASGDQMCASPRIR